MKKLFLLLLVLPFLASCSSDDDLRNIEDEESNLTIEDISGTYTLIDKRDSKTNSILMECIYSSYTLDLSSNGKGSDIDKCKNETKSFSWEWKNNKTIINHTLKGKFNGNIKFTDHDTFHTYELSFNLNENDEVYTYTYQKTIRFDEEATN